MSQTNSILNLLNIQDPNIKILACHDAVENKLHTKEISGTLSYQVAHCPFCRSTKVVKNGYRSTTLKMASLGEQPLRLRLDKQRYLCRDCRKTFSAETNLTEANHSITRGAGQEIHRLATRALSVKTMAEIVGISASSAQRLLYHDKKALVSARSLPSALCFDEFRSTGNDFAFICINAQTHELITLLEDRLTATITEYFRNNYSLRQRQKVKIVTMDLNAQYQRFIKRLFPNAKIVFDRFHVVQLASRALDSVRINALKSLADHHERVYKALKSHWRLFHKDENELNSTDVKYYRGLNEYTTAQNIVDLGLDSFPQFKTAYTTYQEVLQVVRHRDRAALQTLVMTYHRTQTEMDTVITTIKQNYLGIRNACLYDYSNGPLEGVNRKIKELKRGCYGFRNMHNFFIRIQMISA